MCIPALVPLLQGCNGNAGDDTSSPETTAAVTAAVESSDTTPVTYDPVIETGEIISPETPTSLALLYSDTSLKNETIFAAENAPDTDAYAVRDALMKKEYGVSMTGIKKSDLTEYVNACADSGEMYCDFMLVACSEGVRLMLNGRLQDVSEAGINITDDISWMNEDLCNALEFGGRLSLLFCDAIVSDLKSSHCLAINYDRAADSVGPVAEKLAAMATNGSLTFEKMAALLSEVKPDDGCDLISVPDGEAALAVIAGAGGSIFTYGADKLPSVNITSAGFVNAYETALKLNAATDRQSVVTVKKLSDISGDEGIVPLPKSSETDDFRSYTDISGVSVLAAPDGVISGTRTGRLLSALCECSSGVRQSYIDGLATKSGREYSASCLAIIERSGYAEPAACYGWGNLDEYFASGLLNGDSSDTLISAKTCTDRMKVATEAIRIYSSKLGLS